MAAQTIIGNTPHPCVAFAALRNDLPWGTLSADAVRPILEAEGGPCGLTEGRFHALLHDISTSVAPPPAVVHSGLTCDAALAGGRLLLYRHQTLLALGGRFAGKTSAADSQSWAGAQRVEADPQTAPHPLESLDCSKGEHVGTELQPLRGVVRLLEAAGRGRVEAEAGGATARAGCMPAVEGSAACCFGSCVLAHGGALPDGGEASCELRAVRMAPDPQRPGLFVPSGVAIVQQQADEGREDAASSRGGGGSGCAFWEAVSAGPSVSGGAGGAAAVAAAAGLHAEGVDKEAASQPCAPPGPRYDHQVAVGSDGDGWRLWMYGGKRRGAGAVHRQPPSWPGAPHLPAPPLQVDGPADPAPCCYWAALPAGSGEGQDGFPGGDAVVQSVRWHRLPLRPASGGGGGGGGAALPDPLRAAAIAVHGGGLFILSSGPPPAGAAPAAAGGRGGGAAPRVRPQVQHPVWLLHRVDCATGDCQLLSPAQPPAQQQQQGSLPAPPPYHEDAVAMADDALPYIYVYGARAGLYGNGFAQTLHRICLRGAAGSDSSAAGGGGACGGGKASGASWGAACGGGGGGAAGGGGVRWEVVGTGIAQLHVARRAMGAVSGGAVVLAGGVADGRRGVEGRVQMVVPDLEAALRAAAGTAATGKGSAPARSAAASAPSVRASEAAGALCRRELAARLAAVAPQEVVFATPANRRPCTALAVVLAVFSRGGPFDDLFAELLSAEAEPDPPSPPPQPGCGKPGGGGGKRRGGGGGGRGMELPGHDPLAVAAVAGWVMGRFPLRTTYNVAFIAQMFDLARLFGMVALQRACLREVAARGEGLPLPQLLAALALWEDVARLGLPGAEAEGQEGGPEEGDDSWLVRRWAALREVWLRKLRSHATVGVVTLGNVEEVMCAAHQAAASVAVGAGAGAAPSGGGASGGGASGGSGGWVGLLKPLQATCARVAGEWLEAGCSDADAGVATLFACRYSLRPLLFQCMGWWEQRLGGGLQPAGGPGGGGLAAAGHDGGALGQLAALLADLEDLEQQLQQEVPPKRARAAAETGWCGPGGATLAAQLRACLYSMLSSCAQPTTALLVLQAFPPRAEAADPPECAALPYELPGCVEAALYDKLAALPAASQQRLPASFRLGGSDWGRMDAARARRKLLDPRQQQQQAWEQQQSVPVRTSAAPLGTQPLLQRYKEWLAGK